MGNASFRVVLTGDIATGHSREAAIAAMSRLFQCSAADIARVIDAGNTQIGQTMTAEEALETQERLEAAGAYARIDRVGPNASPLPDRLELPPANKLSAGLMRCPACGHEQLVASCCDACGVIFADFNRQRPASPTSFDQIPSDSMPFRPASPRPAPAPGPESRHDWRNDWLDDDAPDPDYHLKLYMGVEAQHLIAPCQRMTVGQQVVPRPSWAWGAVFSPFLWLLYRKMWAWSIVLFVFDVFLPVVMLMLGAKEGISDKLTYAALGLLVLNRLFWPAVLKYLYCRHARGMIAYLNRMSPTFASDIDIATRGGTSRTSVFAGLVASIVILLLTWNVIDTLHDAWRESVPTALIAPPPLPPAPNAGPTAPAPPSNPSTELLVNENKWVLTRNKLRVFGQQVNGWLVNAGDSIDAATLDIGRIASALGADGQTITDGWGRQIRYLSDGTGFRLVSAGPDGEFGTSDDVEYRRTLRR